MPSKANWVFAGPPVHGCPLPTTRVRVPPGFTRSIIPEIALVATAGNKAAWVHARKMLPCGSTATAL